MEKDKTTEIQNIYDKFHQEFYSQEFMAIRDALKRISLRGKNNSKHLHDLGKFVIFYSLPTVNPKVVIIGNNPSWFHKSNPIQAEENLDDVAEKIPTINSYKKVLLNGKKRLILPELHIAAVRYGLRLRRGEQEDNAPGAQLVVESAPACLARAMLAKARRKRPEEATEEDAQGVETGAGSNDSK